MVTSTRSVRLAAMENEDNVNRDVTGEVGPNLVSVGGLVGENGPFQDEGSVTNGVDAVNPQQNDRPRSAEGGIVISSTRVQDFFEAFQDITSFAREAGTNLDSFIMNLSVQRFRTWMQRFPEMKSVPIVGKDAKQKTEPLLIFKNMLKAPT